MIDPSMVRLRRLRYSDTVRALTNETRLSIEDFICPIFVIHGTNIKQEILPMPGYFQFSLDRLHEEVKEIWDLGIKGILFFGLPETKDSVGSGAYSEKGIVQEAIRIAKKTVPEIVVITDVCLCEYTDHGHCGVLENGEVLNDPTLDLLANVALSHARAGADIVAPSAMMDGQVRAIRRKLDENNFYQTAILGYSAKFSSSFYGPFRVAADSAPMSGDRRSYQMNFGNAREALREIQADVSEGADIIMVKPALSYLDVISRARNQFLEPLCAYNVSGEYSMVKAGGQLGWLNEKQIILELLTSIKRAGADIIISYHAKEVAKWLRESRDQ